MIHVAYVDDSDKDIMNVKEKIKAVFKIKDLGDIDFVIGIYKVFKTILMDISYIKDSILKN